MTQAEESDLVERLNALDRFFERRVRALCPDDCLPTAGQEAIAREFVAANLTTREAAAEIARLRAILSAVMNIEQVEPSGDPSDPTSWSSAAKYVVAGSEHDRICSQLTASRAAIEALVGAAEQAALELNEASHILGGKVGPSIGSLYLQASERLSRAVGDARRGNDIANGVALK